MRLASYKSKNAIQININNTTHTPVREQTVLVNDRLTAVEWLRT